ncbi:MULTISPECIES: hypothetical protein [unclassified Novosphingobium]|nr:MULTISPECIES: hypothetical protein [unclassified Novosphingobium]
MLSFLAHMAINAAGIAALWSIWRDARRLGAHWLQVLADDRANRERQP